MIQETKVLPPIGELLLVWPDDHAEVSGGNLFNRALRQSLVRVGLPHRVLSMDQTMGTAARVGSAVFLVDSVLREDLPRLLRVRRPHQRVLLLVHYLHSLDPHRRDDATLARERGWLAPADGLVANSETAAAALAEHFPGLPILRLPTAPIVLPQESTPPSGRRALLVGNLIRCKGILPLLEALAEELRPSDAFELLVLGRPVFEPDHAERCLQTIAAHAELRRAVRVEPPVPPEAMAPVYQQSGLYVAAADFETFGMAMQEARLFGLPIFAVDAPYARGHLLGTRSGELFAGHRELARACVAWSRDAAAQQALRARCFAARNVSPPTWDAAARSLVAQLQERGWI